MSPEESHFLAAIEAEPDNLDRRLVYADWLEEHSDPRAEFIQIWHEMHSDSLKPWTERYLELFRRRQVLRPDIDKGWLTLLGYYHQHTPLFTEAPPDEESTWRLLTVFLELWYQPLTDLVRNSDDEIQEIERQLEFPLPPSLKKWYRYSAWATVGLSGETLATPHSLRPEVTGNWMPEIDVEKVHGQCSPDRAPFMDPRFAVYSALWAVFEESVACPAWHLTSGHSIGLIPDSSTRATFSDGTFEYFEGDDVIFREDLSTPNVLNIISLNPASVETLISSQWQRSIHRRQNGQWLTRHPNPRVISTEVPKN